MSETPVDDRLYTYLLANGPPEHEELQALRLHTRKMPNGRMQITPEQGHFLALLVRLSGARRTLEIGTFTGYSTLAVALALPDSGQVVACDISEEWTRIGRTYWERARMAKKIELRIAPALQSLLRLESEAGAALFDFAFIDADKTGYDAYYESALRLLRPGGLIVLDNMLQDGRVADPDQNDAITASLRRLNTKIARDDRVDRVILPIASGMTLARRRHSLAVR